MKKFLFLGALAAMLLGTASCSDDMEPAMSGDGTVTFKVDLPGAIESRAIADGLTATKLDVACYDVNGNKLAVEPTVKTDFVNREATVTYKLVKGQKYNFSFFAHADGAPYTFDPGTTLANCKFTVDYTGACNDENRDAFYAVLTDYEVTAAETTVTLYRPFAQLNFGADDVAAAAAAGIIPSQSKVTVKQAATEFNLSTGMAGGNLVDVEYTLADLPSDPTTLTVEGVDYRWMEMCYFLVPENEANVDVEMTVKTNNSDVVVPVANVPVKKNHRTNIVGSLFTQDANFRIIIDQNFDNYDYDIVNGVLMIKNGMTAEEINKIIEYGFASFALAEDVDIDNTIVIPAGKTVTLNLNGHKLYNSEDIWNETTYKYELISVEGGDLTINGEGDVIAKADDCYPVSVWSGNLVINGGNYNGNIHAVYVYQGTATINGGSFTLQQLDPYSNDYRQEINCYDANYTNGTAKIIVTGGKFYGFDPDNSMSEPVAPVSLLPAGYESVQDGEWYKVQEIPALSDPAAIAEAVQVPGKTVVVASNVMLEIDPATIATGVTLLGKEGASVKFLNNRRFNNENITVQGFQISNSGISGSNMNIYSNNFTLKDCSFVGSNGRVDEITIYGGDPSGLITIEDCNITDNNVFKAIHIFGKSTVCIKNSVIDATYPFNCNGSNNEVIVENSTLLGWTSYNNGTGHSVTFTNCSFGKGKAGYAYLRPYTNTIIKNSTFSSDYRINPVNQCTITITNSTWLDGNAVDVTLIDWSAGTSGSPNSPTNSDGTTVSIDGEYVHPQS